MSDDVFTDIVAAAAEAHRANEVRSRVDDLLVDGRLLLTEPAFEALKREATVADSSPDWGANAEPLPPWALLSVLAIPDDGAPHDIGNGKIAIVNPFDHKTILVAPAEFLDVPIPMCPFGHGRLENGDCPDCGFAT